jgi:hypothetical protein
VIGSSPLLPTPRANIAKQGLPRKRHWGELRAEVMSLLPTPTAGDGTRGPNSRQGLRATGNPNLPEAIKLLPTPRANDGLRPSPRRSGAGFGATLEEDVVSLSPGAPTRTRSGAGKLSTDLRLSPWFVEWMIGAPHGWSDPDCRLSATEFKSRSATSPAAESSSSKEPVVLPDPLLEGPTTHTEAQR